MTLSVVPSSWSWSPHSGFTQVGPWETRSKTAIPHDSLNSTSRPTDTPFVLSSNPIRIEFRLSNRLHGSTHGVRTPEEGQSYYSSSRHCALHLHHIFSRLPFDIVVVISPSLSRQRAASSVPADLSLSQAESGFWRRPWAASSHTLQAQQCHDHSQSNCQRGACPYFDPDDEVLSGVLGQLAPALLSS